MASQSEIDNIQALFRTKPEDMPRISTRTEKPTYTTIQKFQKKINENAIAILSLSTNLRHLALVLSPTNFAAANGGNAFREPIDPGQSPDMPTFVPLTTTVTTRRSESVTRTKTPAPKPKMRS
jgi:hypothetical protein